MLCVSTADIERKWIGDTEKNVQALFKVSRMLCPGIILIDEADGLFSAQYHDHYNYSRTRKDQLLAGMDGLLQCKSPSFVMLATNFPHQLDHAVLRHVPGLLHLGLPLVKFRKEIREICLRDEYVEPNVNVNALAVQTRGYSGSDIKTFCVKIALLYDTFIDHNGRNVGHLKRRHFDDALQRCALSVPRSALEEIEAFATIYDPQALEQSIDRETYFGEPFDEDLPSSFVLGNILADMTALD